MKMIFPNRKFVPPAEPPDPPDPGVWTCLMGVAELVPEIRPNDWQGIARYGRILELPIVKYGEPGDILLFIKNQHECAPCHVEMMVNREERLMFGVGWNVSGLYFLDPKEPKGQKSWPEWPTLPNWAQWRRPVHRLGI